MYLVSWVVRNTVRVWLQEFMKRELADSEMNESIPTQIFGSTSKRVNAWSSIHPYHFLEPKFDFQGAVNTLTYTRKGINMYVTDCSTFCVVISSTHGYTANENIWMLLWFRQKLSLTSHLNLAFSWLSRSQDYSAAQWTKLLCLLTRMLSRRQLNLMGLH